MNANLLSPRIYPFFKLRLALLTFLVGIGLAQARAEIVLDVSPSDQQIPGRRIAVPKPRDTTEHADETHAPASDTLLFTNNDKLHGYLLSYDKSSGIHWKSVAAKDPMVFQTGMLSSIKLDSHKPPASAKPPTFMLALTNGDELPGDVVSLDDKQLLLNTWYAGQLTIPRAMIVNITPLRAPACVLYEGPTSMEGWVLGNRGGGSKSWAYRDGTLIGSNYGTIGRDVKLPGTASIDFDLVWRGNSQFGIFLYSDRVDSISNCYMFQINSNNVYLQRYSRDGGSNNLGDSAQLRNVMRREKMHVGIRVNKETKSLWLLVDGTVVKQWTDPGEFVGTGKTLIFQSQPGSYARISNIKVATWDGKMDDATSTSAKSKEDSIKLQNQDRVSGKLKSIEGGKATFASSYADLSIPIDRVEQINMSNVGTDKPKPSPTAMRAFFADRGSVTMELNAWDEKKVAATSPNFGSATFSPDAFQRLQFNLDKVATPDDETDEGSGGGVSAEEGE